MSLRRGASMISISSPVSKGDGEVSDEVVFNLDGSHISLSDARLSSLPSFLTKRHRGRPIIEFVTSIDCSVNKISNLENVCEFTKLTRLIASHNRLESTAFDGLPIFPQLDTLYLNHNNINDIGKLIPQLAKVCPLLRSLHLLENPGVPNPLNDHNQERYQQYRYYVISRLPNLEMLDGMEVKAAERKWISERKLSDITPAIPGSGSSVLLFNADKDAVGFQMVKEGELTFFSCGGPEDPPKSARDTLPKEDDHEYVTWDPNWVKVGEGKMLIFQDSRATRPEAVISLPDFDVSIVEDDVILKKMAPELEVLELKRKVGNPAATSVMSHSQFNNNGAKGSNGASSNSQSENLNSVGERLFLVCKDEETLQEWLPILVTQTEHKSAPKDWDEIERQATRMKMLQESLTEKGSQIRLKRALDQSYAIDPKEIQLIRVLGHGGFGTVYLGMVRGKAVAVKVFHNQKLSAAALDDFCNEMEILTKIHHPHVINFIGACLEPLMIVTELMAGGDLRKLLLDPTSSTPLSLLTRLQMAKDAALGMAWLHGSDPMIVHRDVKTANFLVDENLRVVVADFGLSDKLRKGASTWDDDGYKGTIYFTSPEVLKNAVFNEKSDVYSFALVLWQILTRQELYPEFKRVHSNELEKKILDTVVFNKHRPEIPSFCPATFKSLIEDCWDEDPAKRPAFEQVVERIDMAIYEEAIPDPVARSIWQEWFPGRQQARWKTFWERFVVICETQEFQSSTSSSDTLGLKTPRKVPKPAGFTPKEIPVHVRSTHQQLPTGPPERSPSGNSNNSWASASAYYSSDMLDDLTMKLLIHELLSPNKDMVLHQVNSDIIHLDQFGNFAQWFGPLAQKGHNPAKYAESIARNKWFFGALSINHAFNLLNGQPPGTFLVRYSLSRRGDYSASFVTPSGSIAHQHIDRRVTINPANKEKPVSIKYVIPSTDHAYDSLYDLIDDQPYLRNRCKGWPFAWIFAGRLSYSQIEDSFLDTSQDIELQAIRSPRKSMDL